jgi:hypothetical protein
VKKILVDSIACKVSIFPLSFPNQFSLGVLKYLTAASGGAASGAAGGGGGGGRGGGAIISLSTLLPPMHFFGSRVFTMIWGPGAGPMHEL